MDLSIFVLFYTKDEGLVKSFSVNNEGVRDFSIFSFFY